jgi:hypothetical protein
VYAAVVNCFVHMLVQLYRNTSTTSYSERDWSSCDVGILAPTTYQQFTACRVCYSCIFEAMTLQEMQLCLYFTPVTSISHWCHAYSATQMSELLTYMPEQCIKHAWEWTPSDDIHVHPRYNCCCGMPIIYPLMIRL